MARTTGWIGSRGTTLSAAAVALSLAPAMFGGDTAVRAASEYPTKQSQSGVTIAIEPYQSEAKVDEAFPKTNPPKYGILPVLLVMENAGDAPLDLKNLVVRYTPRGEEGIDAIPAGELALWNPKGHQPRDRPKYIPSVPGIGNKPKVKKGPMAKPEVTDSGFEAPVLAPGDSAHGFFYFHVGDVDRALSGATIYISGVHNMTTNQDLFYFELPLD